MVTNLQTKPYNVGCESECIVHIHHQHCHLLLLLSSKLTLLLLFPRRWMVECKADITMVVAICTTTPSWFWSAIADQACYR